MAHRWIQATLIAGIYLPARGRHASPLRRSCEAAAGGRKKPVFSLPTPFRCLSGETFLVHQPRLAFERPNDEAVDRSMISPVGNWHFANETACGSFGAKRANPPAYEDIRPKAPRRA